MCVCVCVCVCARLSLSLSLSLSLNAHLCFAAEGRHGVAKVQLKSHKIQGELGRKEGRRAAQQQEITRQSPIRMRA